MSEQTVENQKADVSTVENVVAIDNNIEKENNYDDNESDQQSSPEKIEIQTELNEARKDLKKRNKVLNNQRNRIRALEAEMAKLKESYGKEKPSAPELEKYESVIDYVNANSAHTIEQKLAEQAHNAKLAELERQKQVAYDQHVESVAAQAQELFTSNPEFAKTMQSAAQVINAMPQHIENMMLELDNSPAAAYALVKEGRLQDIYDMPPAIAAAHLVQAEVRGQQYLQHAAKPQQSAPKPIGSLKGSGKSSKSYADMSADELAKRFLK